MIICFEKLIGTVSLAISSQLILVMLKNLLWMGTDNPPIAERQTVVSVIYHTPH